MKTALLSKTVLLVVAIFIFTAVSAGINQNINSASAAIEKIEGIRSKIIEALRIAELFHNNFSTLVSFRAEISKIISLMEESRDLALNAEKLTVEFSNDISKNKNSNAVNFAGEAKADVTEMNTEINRLLRKAREAKNADSPEEAKAALKRISFILTEIINLLNSSENYIQKSQKELSVR